MWTVSLFCWCVSKSSTSEATESRVRVVPTTYPNIKTCFRELRNGDRVYVRSVDRNFLSREDGERGWHSWCGRACVTNEQLWRERRGAPFPYSGARTVEELDRLYRAQDRDGSGLFRFGPGYVINLYISYKSRVTSLKVTRHL